MAAEPFEYNNPAGRIYQNFKALATSNNSPVQMSQLVKLLGIEENSESVMVAIMGIREDFDLLRSTIEEVKDNPAKYSLWIENLADIEKSLSSFIINMTAKTCQYNIIHSATVALRFIAADLRKEESVPADELEQLRRMCDELRQEIADSNDLTNPLKAWLLDLVRLMRDAIDRYKIRGNRGFAGNYMKCWVR